MTDRRAVMATFAVVALLTVLSSCGSGGVAARVDRTAISTSQLERELEAMRSNEKYVAYIEEEQGIAADFAGRAFSKEAAPYLTADVLTIQITAIAVKEEFEHRGAKITSLDRQKGNDEARAYVGDSSIFASFPVWYQAQLRERALFRAALKRQLTANETLESYYRRNKEEFITPCTRDIVVDTYDAALAARRRIVGGETFTDVARDVSLDTGTAPKGGDLGCNGRNHLQPELNRAAITQDIGEVGQPIKRPEGYHLLLVESRPLPPLKEIRSVVGGSIRELGERRLQAVVEKRLRSAKVVVDRRYGTWDGRKRVVPNVAGATPRPRPLPKPARSSREIKNKQFRVGQEVFITERGFVPVNLVSIVAEDISFINETSETKELHFNSFGWGPTRIPAGKRVKFRPEGAWAISYYEASDPEARGYVQVQPYFEPGEDPGAPGRYDADTPGEGPYKPTPR
ncbi:MAG TPA: peptidylprolyl isomerase [Actinomycetota bacterium]|jgi:hypothetical protein|nr:peptidylprolyl isomerase [Actinomycetota bacterium]